MNNISKVSVVVVVFNEEQYIERCLKAIQGQVFSTFELIIIDDCSTDRTAEIVKSISDDRIQVVKNDMRRGIAYSRNRGVEKCRTEHVFFVDADCVPDKYWLLEGIREFSEQPCLGVEGRTFYETAWTSLQDRIIENRLGGAYNTCNIGYKKEAILQVGGFEDDYELVSEDTDLALKILKKGKIHFLPSMIVVHLQKKLTCKKCFEDARRVFSKVKYVKDTKDTRACFGIIMYPAHLLYIIFPVILLFRYRFKHCGEVFLLMALYVSYIFERIYIWKAAIQERIFLI